MDSIISALIAGGLALIGVVFTNLSNSKQIEQKIITTQAVTDAKLESLKEEVRSVKEEMKRAIDSTSKIPVLETRLDKAEKEMEAIKDEIKRYSFNIDNA